MLQYEGREVITGPPGKVFGIIPVDGSIHIQLDQVIVWQKPAMAQAYDVYIGGAVDALVKVSSEQAAKAFVPTLVLDATYYIRIDSVNTLGTTTGDVISFSTWAEDDILTDTIDGIVIPWTDQDGLYIPHERT